MNHYIETLLFQQFYENLEPWLELRHKAVQEGLNHQPCGQIVRHNELDVTYQITEQGIVQVHVDWMYYRAYGLMFNFKQGDKLAIDKFKSAFGPYVTPSRVKEAKDQLCRIIKRDIPLPVIRKMQNGELEHYKAIVGHLGTPFAAFVQPRIKPVGGTTHELIFSFQNTLGGYEECVMGDLTGPTWDPLTDTTC
ncbi:hypothetical protein [Vibrio phage phiKT1019]|nr:hypothetical protein [Vibrio phage phiKT1019]